MSSDQLTEGDGNVARGWIEGSSLSQSAKESLLRFIQRFPTLTFFRDDTAALDAVAARDAVQFPRWLRDMRQTLAGVMPGSFVSIRFNHSLHPFLDEDLEDMWYDFGLRGYANDEDRQTLEAMNGMRPYPIGETLDTGRSTLAINLADVADEKVYEYNLENLWDNKADGRPIEGSLYEMFNSYAELFEQIVALKVEHNDSDDSAIIEAH